MFKHFIMILSALLEPDLALENMYHVFLDFKNLVL